MEQTTEKEIRLNTQDLKEVGFDSNILAAQVGDKLVLVIDTTQDLGPSSSGKMIGVASTGGFQQVSGGMKLNLYLGKKG